MSLILRSDDFDWRLEPQEYIDNHEKFVKADLIETAVVQFANNGRFKVPPQELVEYMKTEPHWDIQLHGWSHDAYGEWEFDYIMRDISAAVHWFEITFERSPKIWFPPWNMISTNVERVADILGMEVNNESCDITKFIREAKAGTFNYNSVYFHLWNRTEKEQIDEMIEWVKVYENR